MSDDAMDTWKAGCDESRLFNLGGPGRSVDLVRMVFSGNDADDAIALANATPPDEAADLVNGALTLCYALARRYRSEAGIMAVLERIMDHEMVALQRHSRLAAALVVAHVEIADVCAWEDLATMGLDPSGAYNLAAESMNDVLEAADASREPARVVVEAIRLWRRLLPEVGPKAIDTAAQQVWGDAA